jgi:hypothetical protein
VGFIEWELKGCNSPLRFPFCGMPPDEMKSGFAEQQFFRLWQIVFLHSPCGMKWNEPFLWGLQGSSQALLKNNFSRPEHLCFWHCPCETQKWDVATLLSLCPRTNPSDKPGFAKKQIRLWKIAFSHAPLLNLLTPPRYLVWPRSKLRSYMYIRIYI